MKEKGVKNKYADRRVDKGINGGEEGVHGREGVHFNWVCVEEGCVGGLLANPSTVSFSLYIRWDYKFFGLFGVQDEKLMTKSLLSCQMQCPRMTGIMHTAKVDQCKLHTWGQ